MSRFDRALGLARSLAIYHGIPGRQRRMRRLYARFVEPGDTVFDVGAHAGNRTRALAALGCQVVALEPQPAFAALLRRMFARAPRVTIIDSAVGRGEGTVDLSISERTPTVTTISPRWRAARAGEREFAGVEWNRSVRVPLTTLDALIDRFGVPRLIKLDVEGAELDVLHGLHQAVPVVSFEYLTSALDLVEACAARLMTLGPYRFNWSPGESFALVHDAWLSERELLRRLSAFPGARSGDVYARLDPSG
jgi:FkbM family methyltransferase